MRRPVPSLPLRPSTVSDYGRCGDRRISALLQAADWSMDKERVQRICSREGLTVPQRHEPCSRLWLNNGSCARQRPLHRNRAWSFDFVQAQTDHARSSRVLTLRDEHSRACLALREARRINSLGVIEVLSDAMWLPSLQNQELLSLYRASLREEQPFCSKSR